MVGTKRKQRTPEQKEARKVQDRLYYEDKKAGKAIVPRPPKMSPEELKLRAAERQRINRAKAREGKPDGRTREARGCIVKLDEPKPVQTATTKPRKLPIGRKEKPQPKRMANRPEDPNKVKVQLKAGLWVMVDTSHPKYSYEKLLIKYGIAI